MNVLHIVGGLPTPEKPYLQPFIKAQIDSLVSIGINVKTLNLHGDKSFLNYFFSAKKVRSIVNEKKIQIIHSHYSYCGITALLAKTKVPIVLSLMGSDLLGNPNSKGNLTIRGRFDKALTKYVSQKVDRIIVKSPEMKNKLNVKKLIDVVPNGVDFSLFNPNTKVQNVDKFGIKENEFVALFLGDPKLDRKNYSLAKKGFDEFVNKFQIKDAKILNPFGISHGQVSQLMNASNVLLLTSFWEGSPNVIKEAMACDLPIISVDVGDVKEVIGKTFNCFLVDYSAEEIAEKLKVIYDNKLRSNGRENINHLSDRNIAEKLFEIYSEILRIKTNDRLNI